MFEYDKIKKEYTISNTADRAEYVAILAYTAGFLEADGHISYFLSGEKEIPGGNIGISQREDDVLKVFLDWFGGAIYGKQARSASYSEYGMTFGWRLNGLKARALLIMLIPYMHHPIKKAQAHRFILFYETADVNIRKELINIKNDSKVFYIDHSKLHSRERLSEEARIK